MDKYDKKLIMDYINGEDIIGYDIDMLEDDRDFMMAVIDTCNDKEMYNMCGDKLKNDFNFIKYLITKFHDDVDYIVRIGNEYIMNAPSTKQVELKILLCNYLTDFDSLDLVKYKFELEVFYIQERIICQELIDENGYDNTLGFDIILSEFHDSDIIKEFFAKNMLIEIFSYSTSQFEERLHSMFRDKNRLLDMGINTFLINYISQKDGCLSGYVTVHINLIKELNEEINNMIAHWDKYEEKRIKEKIDTIIYEMDRFVNDNEYFWGKELELYKYILVNLGIKDTSGFKILDPEFNGSINDIKVLEPTKLDVDSYRKVTKFLERIRDLYLFDIEPDDYLEENGNKRKEPCKIIKLEPKQKNYSNE